MISAAFRLDGSRFLAGLVLLIAGISASGSSVDSAWFSRNWQTDDGLPDNNVQAIVQGRDNYLWMVTSVGLTRFDGVTFTQFPIEDFTGTLDFHIRMCSRTGVLWMASEGGAIIGLNPDFSVVTVPKTGLPTNAPAAIAEDSEGSMWLGYFGSPWAGYSSGIYRIKNGQVTQFTTKEGVPTGAFFSLSSDGCGNIWLAKGSQIGIFRNERFHPISSIRGMQRLAPTHTNAVWMVVGTGHLFHCDTEGGVQDCGAYQSPSGTARALLEDHKGAVWIGTDGNGLFRYGQTNFEKVDASRSPVLSLAEDGEGNIWEGTAGGGLNRISPSGVRLEEADSALGEIDSICEDTNGRLWGATYNGVLVSQAGGRWNPVFTNASFAGMVMCVAADRDGAVWIGTRDKKLLRLADNVCTPWEENDTAIRDPVFALLPTSKGDLWIVGRHALQRLHEGHLEDVSLPLPILRFSAIAEDAAGDIWVGAKGILMRFDGKNLVDETPHFRISDRDISCIYPTPDGSVWIGCGGLGLLRYKDGRVDQIGLDQGLFDNYISQMVADSRGWFWFGSHHGFFKLRKRELDHAAEDDRVRLRPIVYGRNEGLASLEALSSTASSHVFPRAMLGHDSHVYLLVHTGIIEADPKVLLGNPTPPPVLLTRVTMDEKTIASYGNVAAVHAADNLNSLATPLQLPPSQRHLEFDFTAIHLSAPESVSFRYQLVGFDKDWINAGTERNANYSRLPAGDYQFRVTARTGDGLWSETPAVLPFTVAPFFWQTWWFQLGVLLLFTSSGIAVVRYISFRRLQAEMRLLEQHAALDRERTRIARDLHDDLGCNLNKVALTLDMMQRTTSEKESKNGKVQHCSVMVREVAQSVDEIVWAINPRNDTLRYMVDYISQYAVEFLQAADIPCLMDLPDTIPDRVVSPEARHNLLLVVKEALNNVARHARASEVLVRVNTSEDQVAIFVEDNGQGFERVPDNASCDGLRNMRVRMEEIGGQFQLTSHPGVGTRVAFIYSWPSKVQIDNPNMLYSFFGRWRK